MAADTDARCEAIVQRVLATQRAKHDAYGPSLDAFRLRSLVEKVGIKIRRIRTIEAASTQLVDDTVEEDLEGIVSYCLVAVDRLRCELATPGTWPCDDGDPLGRYELVGTELLALLSRKNHDYGEAWRDISIATMQDEILSRTIRIDHLLRQPEPDATAIADQLFDIANYACFCLLAGRPEA